MIASAVTADDLDNKNQRYKAISRLIYSPKVYILFSSACAPETASLLSLLFTFFHTSFNFTCLSFSNHSLHSILERQERLSCLSKQNSKLGLLP